MFENLNQPYIFNNNFKHSIKTILLVSMAYMLITLYFQPFGINFLNSAKDGYFVLGTGILTALTFFVNTQILPGIFPKTFAPESWTIKKEIVLNAWMFIFLSFSFGFLAYLFHLHFLTYSVPAFFPAALAVLPLVLFNLINYNSSLKVKMVQVFDSGKHWLAEEKKLFESGKTTLIEKDENEEDKATVILENGKEPLTLIPDNLILVKTCGNYVEVYYLDNNKVKKILLRQTMVNLETILSGYRQFLKSHRCCLVNSNHIRKMSGSSGNYQIEVNGLDFGVPVSRSKITEVKNLIADKVI